MTGWDFLNSILGFFPPIVAGSLLAAAGGVLIHGFNRHGMNFIKYGLKQTSIDESLEKRFDELGKSFEKRCDELGESLGKRINELATTQTAQNESLEKRINELSTTQTAQSESLGNRIDELSTRIDGLHTELDTIKVNHFGHLKNYLSVLDGILLDKNIISNQEKARLDNELRGM
jgi:prefoldin subunit 5